MNFYIQQLLIYNLHQMPALMLSKKTVFLAILCIGGTLLFLSGCQSPTTSRQRTIVPAFYHWQTQLQLSHTERVVLDALGAKKLYIKFFDVDVKEGGQPLPQALLQLDTTNLKNLELVPTVFITNRTFKQLSNQQIELLAQRIFNKINDLYPYPVKEYQFDCDWTQTTRAAYFLFLASFKKKLVLQNSIVSATIRLHQLKYPKQTGIPPVDKGMLMYYNVGELANWETTNSILDLEIAAHYLPATSDLKRGNHYPLHLDVALPIFRWGIVFRNEELVYLVNDMSVEALSDTTRFEQLSVSRFRVKNSTYLSGYYLYKGDLIRLESVSPALLKNAATQLAPLVHAASPQLVSDQPKECIVSFYHLDATTLSSYQLDELKGVLDLLSKKD